MIAVVISFRFKNQYPEEDSIMNKKGKRVGIFVLVSLAVLALPIIGSTPVSAGSARLRSDTQNQIKMM